jgi:hypothetical protein
MSLNARMGSNDPRLYHADRDVAHNFKSVMSHVHRRLQGRRWPELEDILVELEVPDEEISRAFDCLCQFIAGAYDQGSVDFKTLLDSTGWFKCHPAAQVAVMSVLGTVILGYHFTGVREVTLCGQGPAADLKNLPEEIGRNAAVSEFLALSRWRRRLRIWWARLKHRLRRKR